jgi:outer membrane immunogenic protein
MKNIILAAAVAAVAAIAAPASAQSMSMAPTTFYGTLGYAHIEDSPVNLEAAVARLGARFGQYLGLEAEGALGVDGYSQTIGTTTTSVKLQHSVAAYAVGYLPLTPKFDLMVRGGYGTAKAKARTGPLSVSDSNDSWNYGVGGQYFLTLNDGVRAEYTRHDFTNNGGAADVWSVSYVRKF